MESLTPFDRIMIMEAYDRCYGLKIAVDIHARGAVEELAHQTGMRVKFLNENIEEVRRLVNHAS